MAELLIGIFFCLVFIAGTDALAIVLIENASSLIDGDGKVSRNS